jgi:galactose mutarotase-like enzyme
MSKPKILQENANYTFHSYFELPYDTDEKNSRTITRDISSYTLPDDAEELVKILVGILEQTRA